MRNFAILAVSVASSICLVLGCAPGAPTDPAGNQSAKQDPLLPSTQPMRRLGNSDFRLTRRDGNRRPFRFSPDGKLLAGANWLEVKLWSFPDGKLLHDLSDDIDCNCIAFSADGSQLLAFEQRQNAIYRFDVISGKLVSKTPIADVVEDRGATYYKFSDDGRWLCSTEEYENVMAWDTSNGKRMFRGEMMHSHQAPVSRTGVLTLWDLFVDRYDITTGDQLTHFRIGDRRRPVSNAEGTLMASYSKAEQGIVFWDPATDERVGGKIPCEDRHWQPESAALSADGRRFVYRAPAENRILDQRMAVFDVQTGAVVSTFEPPNAYFLDEPVISPDGRYVFPSGNRSVFCPVDADTGRPVEEGPDHISAIGALSFTPNGSTLVVVSRDQRRAWDVGTGQAGAVFEQWYHTPYAAAVDDRRAIVSGLRRGGLRLHDIATGAVEQEYETGDDKHLASFQLGADRKTFVGLMDRTYRRWDIATGGTIAEWTMPPVPWGREMQPYGRYSFGGLVLGGSRLYRFDQVRPVKKRQDGSIDWGRTDLLLEDWTTQRVTNRLRIPWHDQFSVADSSDDSTLAVVTSDDWHTQASRRLSPGSTNLLIWDVATGWERLRVARPRPDYFSAFSLAAVTQDVRLAATATNRNRIEIWNGFTGQLIQRFDTANDLTKLAFSDDGKMLASGHLDGRVYLWDTRHAWETAVPALDLSSADAQSCWNELAGEGSAPAKALQRLLGDPTTAAEMLERNLRPEASVSVSQLIGEWIESPSKDAEKKVRQLGSHALDALYDGLDRSKSDERTANINRLIDGATLGVGPSLRRRLLAINLTEQLNSDWAQKIRKRMAHGADDAPETRAARRSMRRSLMLEK